MRRRMLKRVTEWGRGWAGLGWAELKLSPNAVISKGQKHLHRLCGVTCCYLIYPLQSFCALFCKTSF